jgi:hypothetical protein
MNAAEGQATNRLMHQLAGSIVTEAWQLAGDVDLLTEAAATAAGLSSTLDVEAILVALAECGQRHCDAGRA